MSKSKKVQDDPATDIAIIGMAGRFPGANNIEEFWENLKAGVESITFFTDQELEASGVAPEWLSNPDYVKAGGILDDIELFDADFFECTPREAQIMDPQHRLLLECAYEALESSGYTPYTYQGSIGVFAGTRTSEYLLYNQEIPDSAGLGSWSAVNCFRTFMGNEQDYLATRISYKLNLKGPSFTVQSACSTSLVAVCQACESILSGCGCDMALAGGVCIRVPHKTGYPYSEGMIYSSDGHTRSFDAGASGALFSSGVGMVVLKRLDKALIDGDCIHAVIKGLAINNDGSASKAGYTSPSIDGQAKVISKALSIAGVDPESITYIEAHGTGTGLGDPVEIGGLTQAFRSLTQAKGFCAIGSVKANIGHTDKASGVAGLIKSTLMLKHKLIPPIVNFESPNPKIDFSNSPFYINTKLCEWSKSATPRRAGVNCFGVGGTNVHVVLEEAPKKEFGKTEVNRPYQILTLSAKDKGALQELIVRYEQYFRTHPSVSLSDICFTTNVGRAHFNRRLAVVADNFETMGKTLTHLDMEEMHPGVFSGNAEKAENPVIAFLFTGQGAQQIGMAKELYETQPTFRKIIDKCDAILDSYLEQSLLSVLYPASDKNSILDQTAYAQPALFAVEYALAGLWQSWGIEPAYVMGHSVGEYVAACVAEAFSLEDGLKLIAARGRLMQELPQDGEMVALFADAGKIAELIEPYADKVSIAGINGPGNTVISGERQAVRTVLKALTAEGIKSRSLKVSHAFHSPLMDPMLDAFEQVAAEVTYMPSKYRLISNVTGKIIDENMTFDARYWRKHVRKAVQFSSSMETLHDKQCNIYLEVGPHPVLLGMGRQCLPDQEALWLPSLRRGRSDWQQMLQSLASLYAHGFNIDWSGFNRDNSHSRVVLPTYPFQRKRYWVEPPSRKISRSVASSRRGIREDEIHPLLGVRLKSALKEIQFESELSKDSPGFLSDHNVFGNSMFPGAGIVEMVLAAANELFGSGPCELEELVIHEALIFSSDEYKTVQMILTPEAPEAAAYKLFSLESNEDDVSWKLHATGKVRIGKNSATLYPDALDAVRQRCTKELSVEEKNEWDRKRGLFYGPSFQGIKRLWRGEGEVLAQIRIPESIETSADKYLIHPALLDACIQNCAVVFPDYGDVDSHVKTFLNMIWEGVKFHGGVGKRVWSHASVLPNNQLNKEIRTVKLSVFDEAGKLIMEVARLHHKYVNREKLLKQDSDRYLNKMLYELNWQSMALQKPEQTQPDTQGVWIIFADHGGTGDALKQSLEARGEKCVKVFPGEEYEFDEEEQFRINPMGTEDFQHMLKDIKEKYGLPYRGILFLWSLEKIPLEEPDLASIKESQVLGCSACLNMVQALPANFNGLNPPRLWIVTRGTQRVAKESEELSIRYASMWGLGRSITYEYPELQCVMIDLDASEEENETDKLIEEIFSQYEEGQIALRKDDRYVCRLIPHNDRAGETHSESKFTKDRPFNLVIDTPGIIDNLEYRMKSRQSPGPGEIEIDVHSTGLNFKDVLSALGQYPGDPGPLGRECTGTVVALGEDVKEFKVGDEVMAVASGSFSSHVTTMAHCAVKKPADLSFEEASTIPINFLTAYYGLCHLAKMKQGDRILIHAAAGGVGLAAVQLAKWIGAEIFATASSGKWSFLKSLGIKHIMNSRTLEFADQIMKQTGGQGVNIVLNSLTQDFIPKSLSVLGKNGRFLEMGKIGIWEKDRVKKMKPDIGYFPFDLADALEDQALTRLMFQALMDDFSRKILKPLPKTVFQIEDATSAFRYMAQAKHIGKVVVTQEKLMNGSLQASSEAIHKDATYLITGGLGGIGLYVTRWLVSQGAGNLVLLGRKAPTDAARKILNELEEAGGTRIVVEKADVVQPDQIAGVLNRITESMPPLRGIFHTAGVIDDALIPNLTWKRFYKVLEAKVDGTWNLHTFTKDLSLDLFVLFSSTTSLFPGMGRGNYAAANTFMDTMAYYRRSLGLKAVSINWGPWGGAGMAMREDKHVKDSWAARGFELIEPGQGIEALERILERELTQAAVMTVDWEKYLRGVLAARLPFFSAVRKNRGLQKKSDQTAKEKTSFFRKLKNTSQDERRDLLIVQIKNLISTVSGTMPSQLDQQLPLDIVGLDSLMAIELRNRIITDLQVDISMAQFLENPTIFQLAEMALERLETDGLIPPGLSSASTDDEIEEIIL